MSYFYFLSTKINKKKIDKSLVFLQCFEYLQGVRSYQKDKKNDRRVYSNGFALLH